MSAIAHTAKSKFYQALFKAMYLLAFNTFARIGEITSTSSNSVKNIIQFYDVDIINTDSSPSEITVTFRHCKHSKGKPHVISFLMVTRTFHPFKLIWNTLLTEVGIQVRFLPCQTDSPCHVPYLTTN